MKKKTTERFNIILSVVAMVISIVSIWLSYRAFKIEDNRFRSEQTASVIIERDSMFLEFSTDRESARLQGVIVTLPTAITKNSFVLYDPKKTLKRDSLEKLAKTFFANRLCRTDSLLQGEIKIPASIFIDVIVDGQVHLFREDHFFIFNYATIAHETHFRFFSEPFEFSFRCSYALNCAG
jgi:hypothetical protein